MEESHITYSSELHWRIVAKWNEMSYEDFLEKEGIEQSRLVAAYETVMMIEAVTVEDAKKQEKRRSAAKPNNRRRT